MPSTASAEMKACTSGENKVLVAVSYPADTGQYWISEGWWEIPPASCAVVLNHDLHHRYYYVFGIDAVTGDEWSGEHEFCVLEKSFRLRDTEECQGDNLFRIAGVEVDTDSSLEVTVRFD